MTIAEAAKVLSVSEQTIRRRIKAGKLLAELVNGQYQVEIVPKTDYRDDYRGDYRQDQEELITMLKSQNALLQAQIPRLEKQVDDLTKELTESRQRSDSIIMQLSKTISSQQSQIQSQTLLLEDLRQPKPFWHRMKLWKQRTKAAAHS